MTSLNAAFSQIGARNNDVEFHDISARCGGSSPNTKGDSSYFVDDGLHLNKRGYCAAITEPSVQTAFGCSAGSYSCSQVARDACVDNEGSDNDEGSGNMVIAS